MSVQRATELAPAQLTEEQRATLALLEGRMPEILSAMDEALAAYGIQREVYRFSTRRAPRSGSGSGCAMACCACGPPDEACIEDCPRCSQLPEGASGGRADAIPAAELTDEQRGTLELLNDRMEELLRAFDDVLAHHRIDRRVHRFSTTRIGNRDAGARCRMVCCACPPPDEACAGECGSCDRPDAGSSRPIAILEP